MIRLLSKRFDLLTINKKIFIKLVNNFNKFDDALDEILFAKNKSEVLDRLKWYDFYLPKK